MRQRLSAAIVVLSVVLALVPGSALAQSDRRQIAVGSDGTIYLVTSSGRYTVTPQVLPDDAVASLTDLGKIGADLAIPQPAAPAASGPSAPTLLDSILVRGKYSVTVAGVVQSTSGVAMSYVPIQINLMDGAGNIVKSDSTYVNLAPGEKRGFAKDVYLDQVQSVAGADVHVLAGRAADLRPHADLAFDAASFRHTDFGDRASATVHNNSGTDVKSLLFDIVAFDANGKIVGGGSGLLDALPAHGQALAEGSLSTTAIPASMTIYPDW